MAKILFVQGHKAFTYLPDLENLATIKVAKFGDEKSSRKTIRAEFIFVSKCKPLAAVQYLKQSQNIGKTLVLEAVVFFTGFAVNTLILCVCVLCDEVRCVQKNSVYGPYIKSRI